jgi:hypothetical protein
MTVRSNSAGNPPAKAGAPFEGLPGPIRLGGMSEEPTPEPEVEPPPEEPDEETLKAVAALRESPFFRAMQELNRVRGEPNLAIIIAHGMVELMINILVEKKCKHGKRINSDRRGYTHSTKLVILHELGLLSDHHYKLLNWFRDRRNDVAHQPFFKLEPYMLSEFKNEDHRDISKFYVLCKQIVIDVWMQHELVIGPGVLPADHYETTERKVLVEVRPAPKYLIPLKSDPDRVAKPSDEWED